MQRPHMWIKLPNQDEIDCETITEGLKFLQDDSDLSITNTYLDSAGIEGSVLERQTYSKTAVNANFWLHFGSWYDYKLAKHDIARVFGQKGLMRIRTDAEPNIAKYVYATSYTIKPIGDFYHDALFTIAFDNPSGLKYSLYRSDELANHQNDGKQFGMNLPNQPLNYHWSSNSIECYNPSDIAVDPYFGKRDIRTTIRFSGSSIKLENKTTGSAWTYSQSASANDTIVIDGINTYRNGELDNSHTDYGYLSLAPGNNSIQASGASSVDVTISFPFIYLE